MKLRKKGKKPMKNNKEPTCYNCGKSGHFKTDYFKKKKDDKLKKKDADKKKFYKKGKRAMVAAWSNEDASLSESSGAKEINLMADHEVTSSPFSSHSSNNSRISDEDKLSHEE